MDQHEVLYGEHFWFYIFELLLLTMPLHVLASDNSPSLSLFSIKKNTQI